MIAPLQCPNQTASRIKQAQDRASVPRWVRLTMLIFTPGAPRRGPGVLPHSKRARTTGPLQATSSRNRGSNNQALLLSKPNC